MNSYPLSYIEPLFRPPSEARSLILQVTNGCSYNRCTFCEMYTQPQKRFRPRPESEVLEEIRRAAELWPGTHRIFLADGDAMVLSARRLTTILEALNTHFPNLQRVGIYCLPRNLANKSDDELRRLAELKLGMAYVGAESGSDEVLRRVNKGETFDSTVRALNRLGEAGIRRSVMILNGLGGQTLSRQHAEGSAELANATQPEYLATLVVTFPLGEERFRAAFPDYQPLDQQGLFREMYHFVERLELRQTIFRSDHASNYLVLKGVLGRDKAALLEQLRTAIETPERVRLRPEWVRGL